jgi:hypothetical protein
MPARRPPLCALPWSASCSGGSHQAADPEPKLLGWALSCLASPGLTKYFYSLRAGIKQHLRTFNKHETSNQKRDRLMNDNQASESIQGTTLDPAGAATNAGPSLQRASILFVASVSSFIGASLLLASI